jgi:hypothetical protein
MEITGNGEVKGLDSAQGMPTFVGPRQNWAKNASMRAGHVAESHYMGEVSMPRDMLVDNEPKVNPDLYYRDMPTYDGTWREGWFPK